MDIDRARTVLEIVHSGSFLRAADRLHVTQTIVSSRIRVVAWGGELSVWNPLLVRETCRGCERPSRRHACLPACVGFGSVEYVKRRRTYSSN
ncbi:MULTISPECIES: LysR family transcriptional regulator [Mesorhizobium]|uniref:HTH lysR-type domain-containing protein n=1 Tax=Mesorhizobium shonense TaxID=1209948 RepID=A0ABV2HVR1_9HYPH|nr:MULTISPECIES: LysR family transcriptional regulator [unclassified Mesorhizobium]AZO28423.1 LysR family transcriptional regulator [Mesorhizobium sp. M1B.F.Ca.ET.045.04.1.1]RWA66177.1 MAG: LysR family transcriptional regulator [Mesorhizobium sp.]RWE03133.1 MAG: LysR family transcriptional regulator [Mesorhizobium sp.]TIS45548.1 MAG: LysR family transcriptional regulator [Mesorhizobium sp.]